SVAFAGVQFGVANFVGPFLTDILASLAAMVALVILLQCWRPSDAEMQPATNQRHRGSALLRAWSPYLLLVVFVLLWGFGPIKTQLERATLGCDVRGLNNRVWRGPRAVKPAAPLPAMFQFNWLSAAGTGC